jgi:hypothetical protein
MAESGVPRAGAAAAADLKTPEATALEGTLPPRCDAATFMSPQAQRTMADVHGTSTGTRTPPLQTASVAAVAGLDGDDLEMSPIEAAHHVPHRPMPPRIPNSLQEQRRLVRRERTRLESATAFLAKQQGDMDRQRAALKAARSKWKSDVRAAKAAGTSASSRRAAVLRNVHQMLDQQAEVLAQDETILRDTRSWLHMKAERLTRIEREVLAAEESGHNDSMATTGTAAETTAMLAAFLDLAPPLPAHPPPRAPTMVSPRKAVPSSRPKPHKPSSRAHSRHNSDSHGDLFYPRDVNRDGGSRKASPLMSGSRAPTPEVADRLRAIESQLAQVTTMVSRGGGSAANSRSASVNPEGGRRSHRTTPATVGFVDPYM